MFKQRVITALIMAPLALAAVFFLPLHYFAIFIAAAFLIGAWEWSLFCGYRTKPSQYSFISRCGPEYGTDLLATCQIRHIGQYSLDVLSNSLFAMGVVWWLIAVLLVLSYPRSSQSWEKGHLRRALMGWLTLVPGLDCLVTDTLCTISINPAIQAPG